MKYKPPKPNGHKPPHKDELIKIIEEAGYTIAFDIPGKD